MTELNALPTPESQIESLQRALADAERRGAAQVLQKAIAAVEAEEELDGPMPDEVRAAILKTPELVLRANVRATKESIIRRLRALAVVTPEGER